MLIMECDSAKLTQQNLAVSNDLEKFAKHTFPKNPIHCLKSLSDTELLKDVGELYETGQLFRTIVIIGHSNKTGLKISSDSFIEWRAVANWIESFEPHRVILLACEAGQSIPCAALFNGIPSLKEIFASPIPADKSQQYIILGKVLHVLIAKKENEVVNQLMQLTNIIFTRGVMISCTRADYENGYI